MAFSLSSISSEARIKAPRKLILGVEKIGKTSFSCGCKFENGVRVAEGLNDPIVISVKGEEGADDLSVPKFPTAHVLEDVLGALGTLCSEDHEYRTVVIDSASALEPLVWDYVCRQHSVKSIEDVGGGYGKGYTAAAEVFRQILDALDYLRNEKNMASIVIGHTKVKRFDDPAGDSYDQYRFDANDKVAALVARWADLILFANTKVVVQKEDKGFGKTKNVGLDLTGGNRFLFTQKRPAHPGGGRGIYGQLPYELPLDYTAFEGAVRDAMNNNLKKEG